MVLLGNCIMYTLESITEDHGYIIKFSWLNQFLAVKSVWGKKWPKILRNMQLISISAGTKVWRGGDSATKFISNLSCGSDQL